MIKKFLNYELYSVSIKVWLYALLAHSLGVPVLLMLFGMAPANAFELAGFFMLVYNVVGGIAVAYILVIWGVNIKLTTWENYFKFFYKFFVIFSMTFKIEFGIY